MCALCASRAHDSVMMMMMLPFICSSLEDAVDKKVVDKKVAFIHSHSKYRQVGFFENVF